MPTLTFQSTRPHGARHRDACYRSLGTLVSIHAPAWGATANRQAEIQSHNVSIHAPAWGATWCGTIAFDKDGQFQSTRPHGARRAKLRGARCRCMTFQSTRPHGARPRPTPSRTTQHTEFQSTRPHGARPICRTANFASFTRFNPRARMGRDALITPC